MDWKLEEFLDFCRYERGIGKNTIAPYASICGIFSNFIESEISLEKVKSWYRWEADRLKPSTLRVQKKIITFYLSWLFEQTGEAVIGEAVILLKKIRTPRFSRTRRAFAEQTVDRWMSQARDAGERGLHDRLAMELMYCGLRISEVENLIVENIMFDVRALRLIGKGNKERIVALPEQIFNFLAWFLVKNGISSGKIFSVKAWTLRKRIKEYAEMAGMKGAVPHELRHSAATALIKNGAELREVGEYLGHEDGKTTEIYVHLAKSIQREMIDTCHPRSLGRSENIIEKVASGP